MIRNKFVCCALMWNLCASGAFAETAVAKDSVVQLCDSYDGNELKFLQKISTDVLSDPKLRADLIQILKTQNISGCRSALVDYFKGILKNENPKYRRGMQAYLFLALIADVPEAKKMIETEIDKGMISDFIDVLEQTDEDAYYHTLGKWVEKVSAAVRKAADADPQDESRYGSAYQADHAERELATISIWSPLFMNRYFEEAIHRREKLSKKEFSDLNIIFALANGSYREIFLNQLQTLVKLNPQQWVASFRSEQVWVQFRLFPVLKQSNEGAIKRELIWLAQYHQDGRLRLLAQEALDRFAMSYHGK